MKYSVHVKLHQDFIEVKGNSITVGVKARPEKGKANEELVRKLAGHFKIPISQVRIVSGHTSRRKIVEIA